MRDGSVFSQVKVPPIVLFGKLELINSALEDFKALFSLGSTNNLSDLRGKNVERGDCFSVRVLTHVESFDVFGVVVQNNWLMEHMIAKVSFMF